ncbi:MAG: LEA type 2 family protein [Thermodesulfobacteriota bacterium]
MNKRPTRPRDFTEAGYRGRRTWWKAGAAALAAAAVLALAGYLGLPYLADWAAAECQVRLIGLKITGDGSAQTGEPPGGLLEEGREVVEGLLGTFTDQGRVPDPERRHVALVIGFRNPTPLDVTLESMSCGLTVNGKQAATGGFGPEGRVLVEAGGEGRIILPVNVSASGMLSGTWDMLTSGRAEYRIEGRAGLKTFLGRVDLLFDIREVNPEVFKE